MLTSLKSGWNLLVQDESIFIHDSITTKQKGDGLSTKKRPVVTVTDSHEKTIIYGALSLDGKQFFRQHERFDSLLSFVAYLEKARKKFRRFIMIVDRAHLNTDQRW
jgi:hypothetical protein